ncbi:sodium:solute symporter [Marivita sp. S0852]|uniref:sodium:solute symporter n=1 Tax=Marivita sp. S0852 TaxID=3373893 RepID=UPI003982B505
MNGEIDADLAMIDYIVIAGYLGLVIAIGVWVSRQTKTGEDLFLAGRSLGWGVIGFSLFASNISTSTLVGLTGSAYEGGLAVSAYEWMAGIPLLLMAFVFAPVFLKSRISTTPEYLEKRFSRRVRLYFSGLTIVFTVIVDTAGGLYAGAVVMQVFFPDIDIWMFCVGIGIFAGIYTATGGLRAVVYTDVLQAVVLILGTALTAFLMFQSVDFSWATVADQVPEGNLSIVQPIDDATLPWPGLFTGVWLLGFWYWVTNQYIVQRILGAKDLSRAQWGAILGGILKILPTFFIILPGVMAVVTLPDISEPDQVFPIIITQVLPVGLTGLVMAGLIAAIMSTVDSTLNSSSTLLVNDFLIKRDKEPTPEQQKTWGTRATLGFMVIAIAWAPFIQYFGGLWSYIQQAFSVLVPPLVVCFTLGALWPRGTANAAFWTLISGHLLGLGVFVTNQLGIWPLHYTINVTIMTVISAVVFVALSLMDEQADVDKDSLWSRETAFDTKACNAPVWANVKTHAVILTALMIGTLVLFW